MSLQKSDSCIYMLQKLKKGKHVRIVCHQVESVTKKGGNIFFLHLCHTLVAFPSSLALHIPLCDPLTIVRSEHQQQQKEKALKN